MKHRKFNAFRQIRDGFRRGGRRTVGSGVAECILLACLLLSAVVSQAEAVTLKLRVIPEDGHPKDTLFVGRPGLVHLVLSSDVEDTVDAVVLSFLMKSEAGLSLPIGAVGESDWTWSDPYSNYDIRGFNQSYQDGSSPDSGIMYLTNISTSSASTVDSIIGHFLVTPSIVGRLIWDTVTVQIGSIQQITSVILRSSGYEDVRTELEFEFWPITILSCTDVAIGCPMLTKDTLLNQPGQVCLSLPIANASSVSVAGATWSSGTLCFSADTAGQYAFHVVGSNMCSVAACDVAVSVTLGCCKGTTGNVNKSVAESPDLSDLSLLISYLTVTPKPTLPCIAEANVNSSAATSPDLSDLSLLIAYLTVSPKPILPSCP